MNHSHRNHGIARNLARQIITCILTLFLISAPYAQESKNQSDQESDKDIKATINIRGNQEEPNVTYIIPWKEADATGPVGEELGFLVDKDSLGPIFREEILLQVE